jgi:hypothetical protein
MVSVHFTASGAIHRLTLSYRGIVSPFYTYKLHFFHLIKPLIFNYV